MWSQFDAYDGRLKYRTLYQYDVTDNRKDASGNVTVIGKHRHFNPISKALKKRFLENGISAKELGRFIKEDNNEMD